MCLTSHVTLCVQVSQLSQALLLPARKINVSLDAPSSALTLSSSSSSSSSSRAILDGPSDGLSDLLALMIVTDTAFCSDTILPDLLSPNLHNADAYYVAFRALSIVAAARRDASSVAPPPPPAAHLLCRWKRNTSTISRPHRGRHHPCCLWCVRWMPLSFSQNWRE